MSERNLTLLTDLYELTMMQGSFMQRMQMKPSSSTHSTAQIRTETDLPSRPA